MSEHGIQGYFAAVTLVLFLGMALTRALLMRKAGIKAIHFGNIDKKDFLIPPFVFFYFYTVFADAFDWPSVSKQVFFQSELISWIGVLLCFAGLVLMAWSLVSFGRSFRIGIDTDKPDKLITTGAFNFSRNPIYVAFWIATLGQLLIFPNWITLVYLVASAWLFQRQVLREEVFLNKHYGREYEEYAKRVRRYL
jgi:protein-S-isoprenylcysteine O-methyltransferase Ste14